MYIIPLVDCLLKRPLNDKLRQGLHCPPVDNRPSRYHILYQYHGGRTQQLAYTQSRHINFQLTS